MFINGKNGNEYGQCVKSVLYYAPRQSVAYGQYAAFGKVTSGMEYVDKIAETETHSLTDMGMDDVLFKLKS